VKDYLDSQNKQLIETVMLVRQKLSKNQVITVNALIVIDVHAKDVVARLAEEGVRKISN
jgi:dynein heavy chain